ncbi:hypothetical protein D3C85_1148410 [compost metagenome]
MIAIAAAVLDDAHPAFARLEVVPHLPEYLLRHVRVANQVVRAADQLLAAEAADSDELVIAVGDDAAAIGGRSQMLVGREVALPLGDRHVLAHLYSCGWVWEPGSPGLDRPRDAGVQGHVAA